MASHFSEQSNQIGKKSLQNNRTYIAIDLKSFYASVECIERGLDPLTTNLVIADESRTEKTICLAVSPSLKSYGISGRARLFEVIQRVKEVNASRRQNAPGHTFTGESHHDPELKVNPALSLGYIIAPPRMAHYMEYSTRIYKIYLRFVAPEDIHVYPIDEVFMDVTGYLDQGKTSPRDFAMKIIHEVLKETGITAAAGIGSNMYLAKIAMDINAKHIPSDKYGVRIAELDEMSYRKQLWSHRPLTDFWRVGRGYTKKLEANGLYTMGDIARCSIGKTTDYYNEELLYKLFGINAELLIDHAWGWEPCTIADIKEYKPESNCISSGQVLQSPYPVEKAKLIVREMTELLVLDLVDKGLVTDQIVLTIGYDIENLSTPEIRKQYNGSVTKDHYGRQTPKHAHGTANLKKPTSSTKQIMNATMELFDRIINPILLVRRVNITASHVINTNSIDTAETFEQLELFTDYEALKKQQQAEAAELEREKRMQKAMLDIKKRFGKNAILKGTNLEEGATTIERNNQIGGHKA